MVLQKCKKVEFGKVNLCVRRYIELWNAKKSTNGAKLILRNVKFKKNAKRPIKKLNIVNINKKTRCVLL